MAWGVQTEGRGVMGRGEEQRSAQRSHRKEAEDAVWHVEWKRGTRSEMRSDEVRGKAARKSRDAGVQERQLSYDAHAEVSHAV
eukprot:scaffold230824_cov30-Tisochrysis_lutea.AAC.3